MTHQLTTLEAINCFAFAGNSTFTLRSLKTGARFTFKVEASEDGKVHFISLPSVRRWRERPRGGTIDSRPSWMGWLSRPPARDVRRGGLGPLFLFVLALAKLMNAGEDHDASYQPRNRCPAPGHGR
jgi:hypothetical protein